MWPKAVANDHKVIEDGAVRQTIYDFIALSCTVFELFDVE